MYLSLRPFILPQLKMTEKLVQFELTVKILHSDNPESSQKSQLQGIFSRKHIFLLSHPLNDGESAVTLQSQGRFQYINTERFTTNISFPPNCTMTFCNVQTFSDKNPVLIVGNQYNDTTSTGIIAASSENLKFSKLILVLLHYHFNINLPLLFLSFETWLLHTLGCVSIQK